MGWSLGYDKNWERDIGYSVPAYCDHPGCNEEIDRGLSYVCCNQQPYGGEDGCGLYFCEKHRGADGKCARCSAGKPPYQPKDEHPEWVWHKLTDPSWDTWRRENHADLSAMLASAASGYRKDFMKRWLLIALIVVFLPAAGWAMAGNFGAGLGMFGSAFVLWLEL